MHCFNAFLNETLEVSVFQVSFSRWQVLGTQYMSDPGPFSYDWYTTHNFVGCYDYAHSEHIENNHEKCRTIAHDGIKIYNVINASEFSSFLAFIIKPWNLVQPFPTHMQCVLFRFE